MNFRIQIGDTGYDYKESEAFIFSVDAQKYSPHGAALFVDGKQYRLAAALDLAKLYLI